jgi:hypothetical protein
MLTLDDAIERVYREFARYPRRSHVSGCPCCVDDEEARALASAPLRDIPEATLERYAFKAMTTWGDEADFKHFVPPIFERTVRGRLGVNEQIVFGKLAYASWHEWPTREREVIVDLTHAWLRACLEGATLPDRLQDIVESAGVAGIPIEPLIALLDCSDAPEVATAIRSAAFSLRAGPAFAWCFWKDDSDQAFARWLVSRGRARLEEAFFASPDAPDAREWSNAIDYLDCF